MNNNIKIVAFVGMSGSGKSTAIEALAENNIPKIYFGGVIYRAMEEEGVERTPDSEREFREQIREKEGTDFVVKRVVRDVKNLIDAGQKRIVLDGLYSWTEYKILKKEFPTEMTVVAIMAPKKLRHKRVGERKERPFNAKEINERDWSEIENLEKGGPIANADYFIDNSGDLGQLHSAVRAVLKEIEFLE